MKHILYILFVGVALTFCACNDDDYYIDTGKANGKFNGSVMDYLRSDHYNWDSTVLLIERAGLVDLFEGNDPANPEITFFGPTNHSIRQYLLNNPGPLYKRISDIPEQTCKNFILQYVYPEKKMKSSFDYEVKGTNTGGNTITCLGGNNIRVFRTQSDYNGVANTGPEGLGIQTYASLVIVAVASADIEPTNGVVHALPYTFKFGNF